MFYELWKCIDCVFCICLDLLDEGSQEPNVGIDQLYVSLLVINHLCGIKHMLLHNFIV